MSTGDFEAELQQSVHDHLALIAAAAKAAKGRIGTNVKSLRASEPAPAPAFDDAASIAPPPPRQPRPAVNFDAPEPDADPMFATQAAVLSEADAFAEEPAPSPLPQGAISFDDLAVEGIDEEGIPVWEDPP
jgi:hypothetical protein